MNLEEALGCEDERNAALNSVRIDFGKHLRSNAEPDWVEQIPSLLSNFSGSNLVNIEHFVSLFFQGNFQCTWRNHEILVSKWFKRKCSSYTAMQYLNLLLLKS